MVVAGAGTVVLLRDDLLRLLLGAHDAGLSAMTERFALLMVPIGILQAIAIHSLASRRTTECFVFGACALMYLAGLLAFGQTPFLMLRWMGLGAVGAIFVVGTMLLFRLSFPSPRE
jgi:hypothetical protein